MLSHQQPRTHALKLKPVVPGSWNEMSLPIFRQARAAEQECAREAEACRGGGVRFAMDGLA